MFTHMWNTGGIKWQAEILEIREIEKQTRMKILIATTMLTGIFTAVLLETKTSRCADSLPGVRHRIAGKFPADAAGGEENPASKRDFSLF